MVDFPENDVGADLDWPVAQIGKEVVDEDAYYLVALCPLDGPLPLLHQLLMLAANDLHLSMNILPHLAVNLAIHSNKLRILWDFNGIKIGKPSPIRIPIILLASSNNAAFFGLTIGNLAPKNFSKFEYFLLNPSLLPNLIHLLFLDNKGGGVLI
jgi:hypothetical protein